MDKFIIDRQFGIAIWIDVENGIVQKCYNESPKFLKKMNELYKGKTITFLKEDFIGRAMKGVYHSLRPEATLTSTQKVWAVASRISAHWLIMNSQYGYVFTGMDSKAKTEAQTANRVRIKAEIDAMVIEQSGYEKELEAEQARILSEHGFQCPLPSKVVTH